MLYCVYCHKTRYSLTTLTTASSAQYLDLHQ